MLKLTQAPTEPIPIMNRFYIAGTADLVYAGENLILNIDNQLQITGPTVTKDGSWRINLFFQKPGNYSLIIVLDTEKIELAIQVIVAKPLPGVPKGEHRTHLTSGVSKTQTRTKTPTLEQLVRLAYEQGFSDIHLGVGKIPRFRHRGQIEKTNYPETKIDIFESWLREVLKEEEIQQFYKTLDFDGSASYEFARVRLNVFGTFNGPAMVLRLIPLKVPTLEALGFPKVFQNICNEQKGLVLITGPTGSGKTTTLAAMINYINKNMAKHIITIEDPIEFVYESQKSLINQREVGIHTLEFDRALKAALREDPDIILIGEMRDRSTVNTALKAAQTGHLVFGTLHTNSAVKTIDRILNLYNPDEQEPMRVQFSDSLVAVIAQNLVRTKEGKRTAIHEIMINTDTIKDYLKEGKFEEIEANIYQSDFYGMCTMNQSIYKLYAAGIIIEETALEASNRPNELSIMLKGGTS